MAAVVALGLVVIATFLVVYLVNEPHRRAEAAAYMQQSSIDRGTTLFVTYCITCHGPDGMGTKTGPNYIGLPLNTDANKTKDPVQGEKRQQLLETTITNGRGTAPRKMPAWGAANNGPFNTEQVDDLVNMIRNGDWAKVHAEALKHYNGNIPTPTPLPSPSPEADSGGSGDLPGKAVFGTNCTGCHTLSPDFADKGTFAPNLTGIGKLQKTDLGIEVSEPGLVNWISNACTIKPGTAMPCWKGTLTDQQIKDVADYLLAQKGS